MNNQETRKGIVIEMMPNATFNIEEFDTKLIIRAYLSGKMKMNRIAVIVGDTVEYIVDKQGPNNRVIRRL